MFKKFAYWLQMEAMKTKCLDVFPVCNLKAEVFDETERRMSREPVGLVKALIQCCLRKPKKENTHSQLFTLQVLEFL